MKGQQESLTTVVIKQAGPAVPASSNTDGSRPEWLQISKLGGGEILDDTTDTNDQRREPTMGGGGRNLGRQD
jgi:hypothetical protein